MKLLRLCMMLLCLSFFSIQTSQNNNQNAMQKNNAQNDESNGSLGVYESKKIQFEDKNNKKKYKIWIKEGEDGYMHICIKDFAKDTISCTPARAINVYGSDMIRGKNIKAWYNGENIVVYKNRAQKLKALPVKRICAMAMPQIGSFVGSYDNPKYFEAPTLPITDVADFSEKCFIMYDPTKKYSSSSVKARLYAKKDL